MVLGMCWGFLVVKCDYWKGRDIFCSDNVSMVASTSEVLNADPGSGRNS